MFSGGALSRFTVFALGIMPYISASIIMQLMTYVVPTLEALKKEGEAGPPQDHAVHALRHAGAGAVPGAGHRAGARRLAGPGASTPGFGFRMTAVVSLVAGTMFLMWLGEQITERGLGNGISILIFAGIAAGSAGAIGGLFELVRTGAMSDRRLRCSSSRWSSAVTFAWSSSSAGSARSWSTTPSARSATRSTAARRRTCR